MDNPASLAAGQTWQRKKDDRLVRIVRITNVGSDRAPFHDVAWETLSKPIRRGECFENYWRRDYTPVTTNDPS